jgi:hypothetical protein
MVGMKWVLSVMVVGLYGVVLWGLPVKGWTDRKARNIGLALILPFEFLQYWLSGDVWFWVL